jgi:hypothetical protein
MSVFIAFLSRVDLMHGVVSLIRGLAHRDFGDHPLGDVRRAALAVADEAQEGVLARLIEIARARIAPMRGVLFRMWSPGLG